MTRSQPKKWTRWKAGGALLILAVLGSIVVSPPTSEALAGNNMMSGAQARTCMGQPATWVGTGNDDVYWGTPGDDVIVAGAGNDQISGGGGHDLICGGDGNDILRGNGGIDTIYGGNGDDRIEGGRSIDVLHGERGNDVVDGNEGPDLLRGGPGNDLLRGGSENDDLHGGSGYDRLFAGPGHNFCTAGNELARCERKAATHDFLHRQWTPTDQSSFAQVAWLRHELAKDNVGGPYTGQIGDAMFNRLSGIICQRSCISVRHNRSNNAVTIDYQHNVSNVIAPNGHIRYVPPPPRNIQVPVKPPVQVRDLSRASNDALDELTLAEWERDETLEGARYRQGKFNEAAKRVNNPWLSEQRELKNYLEQAWRYEQSVQNAVDAQARYDAAVQVANDEHKASGGEGNPYGDGTNNGGSGNGGISGGGSGGSNGGGISWPVSCGTCP